MEAEPIPSQEENNLIQPEPRPSLDDEVRGEDSGVGIGSFEIDPQIPEDLGRLQRIRSWADKNKKVVYPAAAIMGFSLAALGTLAALRFTKTKYIVLDQDLIPDKPTNQEPNP
jgi:hypothetical protein